MLATNVTSALPNPGLRFENLSVLTVGPNGPTGPSDPFAAILSLRDFDEGPATGPAATSLAQATEIPFTPEPAADPLPLFAATGKILPLPANGTPSEPALKEKLTPAPDVVLTMPSTIAMASPLVTEGATTISQPSDAKRDKSAREFGTISTAAIPTPLVIDRLPQPAIRKLPGEMDGSDKFDGADGATRQRGELSAQNMIPGVIRERQAAEARLSVAATGTTIPSVSVTLSVAPFSGPALLPADRRVPGNHSEERQGSAAVLPAASAAIASVTVSGAPKPTDAAVGEAPIATDPATLHMASTDTNGADAVQLRPANEARVSEEEGSGAVADVGTRRHGTAATAASDARQVPSPVSSPLVAASAEGTDKATMPAIANTPAHASPAGAVDRAEAVANVVDRLMAARAVGLGAVASVAVDHREFGELKVNFADRGERLEVTIDAVDTDKQRALAASLHSQDRSATREPLAQAPPAPLHHATSISFDRGGDGNAARNGGHQQENGQAMSDQQHRATSPDASGAPVHSQDAKQERGGIYV